jgi:hypothetical protein
VADGAEEVAEAVAVGSLAEVTEAEAVAVVAAAESETNERMKSKLYDFLEDKPHLKDFCKTFLWWSGPIFALGLIFTNSGLGEVLMVAVITGIICGLLNHLVPPSRGSNSGGGGCGGGCGGCGGGGGD